MEAEYFSKKISEMKTVEMAIDEVRYSSDLFYFIE
jgi:hypothetical protein